MQNVAELFQERAEKQPRADHLRFREGTSVTSLSRSEFGRLAASWGSFLSSEGIGRGDRVGLITEKSPNQMRAFFAIFQTGATAVPVAEELPVSELSYLFSDAEPRVILASPSYAAKARKAAGSVPVIELNALPPGPGKAYTAGRAERGDVACLIYTSGSTGHPKGVMLTHLNFLANSASSAELINANEKDVVFSILPYWHSFGLTVELFTLLMANGAVAIPQDKRDFARNMAAYRPTIVPIVPRIAEVLRRGIEQEIERATPWKRRLFQRALANGAAVCTDNPPDQGTILDRLMRRLYLRFVLRRVKDRFGTMFRFLISGGAPLEKEYQVFFKRLGVPIFQGYGLTESAPVISASCPHCHRLGSSGKIASWLQPEQGGDFTFEAENGQRGKDVHGELLVRGDCVMAGYWRREEETAAALRDGWLHTGDVGWADDDLFLYLSGRRSNLVCLVGGEKFHPEPVEERLKISLYITDCVMYGEGRKNAYALIVPDEDHTRGMGLSEMRQLVNGDVTRLLADSPAHWRPKDFEFVEPFSVEDGLLTSTMKAKRAPILRHYARVVEAIDVRNGEAGTTPIPPNTTSD